MPLEDVEPWISTVPEKGCRYCGRLTMHAIDCPFLLNTIIAALVGATFLILLLLITSLIGGRSFLDVGAAVTVEGILVGMLLFVLVRRGIARRG